jgi:hypothetical protein
VTRAATPAAARTPDAGGHTRSEGHGVGLASPNLTIGHANDAAEREADTLTDRMFAGARVRPVQSAASVARKCAACEEEPKVHRESAPGADVHGGQSAPPSVANLMAQPGRALDPATRSFFESRLGTGLADVRVHDGGGADAAARAIGARAFTVGQHIAFAQGEFAPHSSTGQRLIGHELVHVAQNNGGAAMPQAGNLSVSRADDPAEHEADRVSTDMMTGGAAGPVRTAPQTATVHRFPYETRGITLNAGNVGIQAAMSYWEQRTMDRYDLTVSTRMQSNSEERDAVLAALWGIGPPATVAARTERLVPIDARPAPPPPAPATPTTGGSAPPPPTTGTTAPPATGTTAPAAPVAPPPLLYRFIFTPFVAPATKPGLTCEFVASGTGALPVTPPAPAAGATLAPISADSSDFPTNRDTYLAAHPDELAKLQGFLATAPATFDQILTLTTTNRTGTVTHQTHVHTVRTPAQLDIDYLSESAIAPTQTVPTDYRTRDSMDFEFEKLRRTTIAAANRLGTVTLPTGIPANEVIPVKLAIQAYFISTDRPARNTEVDAIVPLGNPAGDSALYQLRFGTNNDVVATRIGLAGVGTGRVNTSALNIMRVNGFPGVDATDPALRAWWTSRYPSGGALTSPVPQPPATPPPAGAVFPNIPNGPLIVEMAGKLGAGATTAAWFSGNYGVSVLDRTALATRLETVHTIPVTLLTDTVDFQPADFTSLELAYETLSPSDIANLRGINIGRKSSSFAQQANGTWAAGAATQYGLTLQKTSGSNLQRTTVYFNSIRSADNVLFRGSTADNALPDSSMNMLHELGHGTGYGSGIETVFTAWRAAHIAQAPAPTWYGASAGTEVFPEFFGLFHTDPHFLCGAAPMVYAWFAELSRTGTPPPATATLTAPTTCPP